MVRHFIVTVKDDDFGNDAYDKTRKFMNKLQVLCDDYNADFVESSKGDTV